MNIAVQLDSLASQEDLFTLLNGWEEENLAKDISVFYDDIGFNPIQPKFALFNSTDMWYHTGYLVLTSLQGVAKSLKTINKFKPVFLYDSKETDIFGIINTFNIMKIIVRNNKDFEYVQRICNKEPKLIENLTPESIKKIYNE